jgi:hypothetical protein
LATPNYGYEKRQRELAKKKKKEEKLKAKSSGRRPDDSDSPQGDGAVSPDVPGDAPATGEGTGSAD